MEVEIDKKELKAAGAELLSGDRRGLCIRGWEIESCKASILNSLDLQHKWQPHQRKWFDGYGAVDVSGTTFVSSGVLVSLMVVFSSIVVL